MEKDWEKLPARLYDDMEFTLWCIAYTENSGNRLFWDTELYWKTNYKNLYGAAVRFVGKAGEMLDGLDSESLFVEWPGSSANPFVGPKFGLPTKREKI